MDQMLIWDAMLLTGGVVAGSRDGRSAHPCLVQVLSSYAQACDPEVMNVVDVDTNGEWVEGQIDAVARWPVRRKVRGRSLRSLRQAYYNGQKVAWLWW